MKNSRKKMIYGLVILAVVICLAIVIMNGLGITGNPVVLWDVGGGPQKEITCTDSDGGLNLYTKGTCQTSLRNSEKTDSCKSGYVLVEAYCYGTRCMTKEYTCSDACISGACMKPSTIKRTR